MSERREGTNAGDITVIRLLVTALPMEAGAHVALDADVAHHAADVLRVRAGDTVTLFDGHGVEARARITEVKSRPTRVAAVLDEAPREGVRDDAAHVTLLQAIPRGEKLERIVRQATELGVARIVPVYSTRSQVRPAQGRALVERMRTIAVSAAEQSGRADVPPIEPPAMLAEALAKLEPNVALRIVAWEGGGEPVLDVLRRAPDGPCAALVGPEGGLAEDEVAAAREHGFVPVSLGPRILRTETVAPALLAVISALRGDLARG